MTVGEWVAALMVADRPAVLAVGPSGAFEPVSTGWSRDGGSASVDASWVAGDGFVVTSVVTVSGVTLETFDEPVSLPAGFVWDYRLTVGPVTPQEV